jgi:L-methionine (R)-S-oxide reductase
MTPEEFAGLLDRVKTIVDGKSDSDSKLHDVCKLLAENVAHYNWVGFYLVDRDKEELVLGPFVGESTEHTRIAFGQGICGQAASTELTYVVQDVEKESNYLSCSPDVKSEIVVPIFKGRKIAGELDIDSHALSAFTEADQSFLDEVCTLVAPLL